MRTALVLFSILVLAVTSPAQDISGIWRGHFSSSEKMSDIFNIEERYKFEVQLDQQARRFKGVTYSYNTTAFYGKASAGGTINPATGKVLLEELKLLEIRMPSSNYACIMTCFLQYTKNGAEEFLEGKYTSFRASDSSFCGKGTVFLRKVATSDFSKEPFIVKREQEAEKKKTSPVVPYKKPATAPARPALPAKTTAKKQPAPISNTPSPQRNKPVTPLPVPEVVKTDLPKRKEVIVSPRVLVSRENELVKTITVNTNEITINLYDNGTIDRDTVSVYLDKRLVVSRQMLTTSPITFKVNLNDEDNYHELVMVAENLGDIPPNTSLMVVKAGNKEYEVRITSTEQKNAVVVFRYDKNAE